ncbi:MAG: hypothetical protein QM739_08445 [Propionivibrio sp.]
MIVALCSNQLAIGLEGRRYGGVQPPLHTETFDKGTGNAWEHAAQHLSAWLEENRSLSGQSATIILSNRLTRFCIVPWANTVQRDDETYALAVACFESQYGDMSDWTIRIDDGGFGYPRFACAIQTDLLATLRSIVQTYGLRCRRIEPFFLTCWNRYFKQIEGDEAIFAVEEADALIIATFMQDRWRSIRTVHGPRHLEDMALVLKREALLQLLPEATGTWLCSAQAPDTVRSVLPLFTALSPAGRGSISLCTADFMLMMGTSQ